MVSRVLLACFAVAAHCQEIDVPPEPPGSDVSEIQDRFLGIDSELLNKLNRGLEQDISEVKQPITKAVAAAVFSQCDNVKKLFGLSYEQLDGQKEPDVNSLTLKYLSRDVNVSYNINAAPRLISEEARRYQPNDKLVIYIHGFTDDPGQASFGNVSEAFYAKGMTNVLALDGGFLFRWLYLRSTTYVQFVGEKLGAVLAALIKHGMSPSSIHVVGHSLGAHMAGFTGKTFTNITGQRVGRITGLDPAGPCFAQVEPDLRLKATDADFVDVIHTNAGLAGIEEPVGQVDYYPNGGSEQPGCPFAPCSHSRSWLIFAESTVNPQAFPAIKCESWKAFQERHCVKDISYMGLPSKPGTRGLYFLQTNGESPFSFGPAGLKYQDKSLVRGLIGKLG